MTGSATPSPQLLRDAKTQLDQWWGSMASSFGAAHWVVDSHRSEAWQNFEQLGFPARALESWHYTDISRWLRSPLNWSGTGPQTQLDVPNDILQMLPPESYKLVFRDGDFVPELSILPAGTGISVGHLRGVWQGDLQSPTAQQVVEGFARSEAAEQDGFTHLNQAMLKDGYFLVLGRDVQLDRPIYVLNWLSGSQLQRCWQISNWINLAPGSQATVVEVHVADENAKGLWGGLTMAHLGEQSNLRFSRLEKLGSDLASVNQLVVSQAQSSLVHSLGVTMAGGLARGTWQVKQSGRAADSVINGLNFARGQDHIDQRSVVRHLAEGGTSQQLFKSVLSGEARSVFNGKIHIAQGAQQVQSRQLSQNLLLSEKAEVDVKPELEVYADNVKANHGATVGQLDEEQIFYLLARGIDRTSAIKLLAEGFVQDLVTRFPDPIVRDWLRQKVALELARLSKEIVEMDHG